MKENTVNKAFAHKKNQVPNERKLLKFNDKKRYEFND